MSCNAKSPIVRSLALLVLMVAAMVGGGRAQAQPPPNCRRKCGDIDVPYPFGLKADGEGCYLELGFSFTCNSSFAPPKLFQGNVEVASVDLSSSRMRVLLNLSYECYNSSGLLDSWSRWRTTLGSPYRMSYTENVFTAVGCDTVARFGIGRNNFGGCISGCNGPEDAAEGRCSGVGCCQASLPQGVGLYWTGFLERSRASEARGFNPCSYSFVAEKGNYTFSKKDLSSMDGGRTFPVAVDWAIRSHNSCADARKNASGYACVSSNSSCMESINGEGYTCRCSQGYQGNPYLRDGCTDIDECKVGGEQYPCHGRCVNREGGYDCFCAKGFHSDDPKNAVCTRKSGTLTPALKLLTGLVSGLAFLFIVSLICCLELQRRKLKKLREKRFEQNGGHFLQEALTSARSTFKIFSMAELEKATNGFDEAEILGRGGHGTVYRGKLGDGRVVAIKKSMVVDEKNSHEFANELFILSEINHRCIVKLLGCCLDDEVPMLVYEFVSRGTLFGYLHSGQRLPIPFAARVRIAAEAAAALKYLHDDASPPIIHGDVKTSNILLDEQYVAKVSDFGTSTLAAKDKSQFTTFIQGTYGYLDPEYMINGCLTDKSDVFSFVVVLAELLTRRTPFNFEATTDMERSLAVKFISCANGDRLDEILDPEIAAEGLTWGVRRVVEVALQCLSVKGEDRPSMKHVATELELAAGADSHPWVKHDGEEVARLLGGEATEATSVHNTETINLGIFGIEGGR